MKAANDNDPWATARFHLLPKSMTEARASGVGYYFTGDPCKRGHITVRYRDGACFECAVARSRRGATHFGSEMTGEKTKSKVLRLIGQAAGEPKYVPGRPCKHGHWLRWTSTNNCVICERNGHDEHKEHYRDRYLRKTYGIGSAEVEDLITQQDRKCGVCLDELVPGYRQHVDHCHESGKVRGILCSRCNQALGLLQENEAIIRRAADYIARHSEAA